MAVRATSGAFGSDLPYLVDDRSVDQDGRVSPGALQSLWTRHSKRFSESRKRILFAQDVATGKVQCPVLVSLRRTGVSSFRCCRR